MKKKLAAFVALVLAIAIAIPTITFAQTDPEEAGMVAIRAFFEEQGGDVTWQGEDRNILVSIDGGTIVLFPGETRAYTNGVAITLQDGVYLWQNRAFISADDLTLLYTSFIATLEVEVEEIEAEEVEVVETAEVETEAEEMEADEIEAEEATAEETESEETESEEAVYEIASADFWTPDSFADVREPMFSTDLEHGQIAAGYIQFMNDYLYGRSAFTYREKEAAIWIVEELLAMGHDWENIYVQEFTHDDVLVWGETIFNLTWYDFATPPIVGGFEMRQTQLSQNVILTIPGQSSRKIVVGAHYDTPHYNALPYPGVQYGGASDNASGTALLLESAQRMLELDNYYTIVYVFFGAEEVGLLGAHYYHESLTQRELDNLVFMVNADILIEGPYFFYGVGEAGEIGDAQHQALVYQFAEWMEVSTEEMEELLPLVLATIPDEMLFIMLAQLGLLDVNSNAVAELVDEIAQQVIEQYELDLIALPEGIFVSSDQLVFVNAGHTVVSLFGLSRIYGDSEGVQMIFFDYFTASVLHSPYDDYHHIQYTWPGLIDDAMRTFSLFLEAILLGRY